MDRTACVEVSALPLQLLLRRRPEWAGQPAAVVDRDAPQGRVLWSNAPARERRVRPGLRYAAALSLCRELRAAPVADADVAAAVAELAAALRRFSPGVEPSDAEPGVVWLDARGLGRLYASATAWAREVQGAVAALGFACRVAVGFSRFGSYAAARAGRAAVTVYRSAAEEQGATRAVPLAALRLAPRLLEQLERLGIATVGAFVALPEAGLRRRFGPEAQRLHRLAAGAEWTPLQPRPEPEVLSRRAEFDAAENDLHRLLFQVKRLLDPLLARLAERGEALAALRLELTLDEPGGPGARSERLCPAAPTLDSRQLLNLVHLRLEPRRWGRGVEALELTAEPAPLTSRQLALFAARPRRDPEAAARALARVRAEFGDAAVVRAVLREAHLPEACFAWEPLSALPAARPREVALRPLVRRIAARPPPLPHRPGHAPDAWLADGPSLRQPLTCAGPFAVSGGWWHRPVHREYVYVRLPGGALLWLYRDRVRRRWYRQGEVQ